MRPTQHLPPGREHCTTRTTQTACFFFFFFFFFVCERECEVPRRERRERTNRYADELIGHVCVCAADEGQDRETLSIVCAQDRRAATREPGWEEGWTTKWGRRRRRVRDETSSKRCVVRGERTRRTTKRFGHDAVPFCSLLSVCLSARSCVRWRQRRFPDALPPVFWAGAHARGCWRWNGAQRRRRRRDTHDKTFRLTCCVVPLAQKKKKKRKKEKSRAPKSSSFFLSLSPSRLDAARGPRRSAQTANQNTGHGTQAA